MRESALNTYTVEIYQNLVKLREILVKVLQKTNAGKHSVQ